MISSRKKILFGLAGVILVVVFIEIISAIFFHVFEDRFSFFEPDKYLVKDKYLEKISNRFDVDLGWDYRLDTPLNERKRMVDYDQPLISTFGDSYTFCDDVDDDESWQHFLSEELQADVYNFGVNAYGTDQAYLKFQKYFPNIKTPIVTLGLITENLKRMVNVFRPFYYRKTGVKMTKPRFLISDGELTLLPNPLQRKEDIIKLQDSGFIQSLGKHDWWYNRDNEPIRKFPYTAILFNKRMWLELKYSKEGHEINDLDPRPWDDIWEDTAAPEIMLAIIDTFVKEAKSYGAVPMVIVLAKDYQVKRRVKKGKNPQEIVRVLAHCRENGYLCFDAASAMASHIKSTKDVRKYFKNHMNRRGNKLIAQEMAAFLRQHLETIVSAVPSQ